MATKITFVKATPLTNVRDRIDYISNSKRQEHLLAFYQTPADPKFFWKALSDVTQERIAYNKDAKKHIEAREEIITLPWDFDRVNQQELAEFLANTFKRKYGVECAVAIHINKAQTTLHAHLIFSERKRVVVPKISIASHDTYR